MCDVRAYISKSRFRARTHTHGGGSECESYCWNTFFEFVDQQVSKSSLCAAFIIVQFLSNAASSSFPTATFDWSQLTNCRRRTLERLK